ncbi:4'-phosphopantetheinyl transferase family protein [Rudaeicoccus suwonensis]|nr:4'-phosphopantetheinyl transferase superfamily protein [Rudaeicoccus suwonensis]
MRMLLPTSFAVCETSGDIPAALPEFESVVTTSAQAARRAEFATGRWCARRALGDLDPAAAHQAVPVGDDRAPVWPPDVVGSITHCTGLRSAVVARRRDVVAVGVDAEPARPLPLDAVEVILRTNERQYAESALSTVVFTVKEALFKAWWPLTRTWLDFQQARVTLGDGTADVDVLTAHPDWPTGRAQVRWSMHDGLIRTAVWIPAEP